jgi:hypothetical protein
VASIDKRPDGRYRTRWRESPGGPQKTRHFDRKGDAQQFLDGVEAISPTASTSPAAVYNIANTIQLTFSEVSQVPGRRRRPAVARNY